MGELSPGSDASGLKRASFYALHWRGGGEVSSTSKPPLKKGGNASVPERVGKGAVSLRFARTHGRKETERREVCLTRAGFPFGFLIHTNDTS